MLRVAGRTAALRWVWTVWAGARWCERLGRNLQRSLLFPDHPYLEPRHFVDEKAVNENHKDYMFLECILFITEVRRGQGRSPRQPPGWNKLRLPAAGRGARVRPQMAGLARKGSPTGPLEGLVLLSARLSFPKLGVRGFYNVYAMGLRLAHYLDL